jgi:hypothetical protein
MIQIRRRSYLEQKYLPYATYHTSVSGSAKYKADAAIACGSIFGNFRIYHLQLDHMILAIGGTITD